VQELPQSVEEGGVGGSEGGEGLAEGGGGHNNGGGGGGWGEGGGGGGEGVAEGGGEVVDNPRQRHLPSPRTEHTESYPEQTERLMPLPPCPLGEFRERGGGEGEGEGEGCDGASSSRSTRSRLLEELPNRAGDPPAWFSESCAHLVLSETDDWWLHEEKIHKNVKYGFEPVMHFLGWTMEDMPHDGNCCSAAVHAAMVQEKIRKDCPSVQELRKLSAEKVQELFFPKEGQPTIHDSELESLFIAFKEHVDSLLATNPVRVGLGITSEMSFADLTENQVRRVCDQFASKSIDFDGLFMRALATVLNINLMVVSFIRPNQGSKFPDALLSLSFGPVGFTDWLGHLPLVLIGHCENSASSTEKSHFVQLKTIQKDTLDQCRQPSGPMINPGNIESVAVGLAIPLCQKGIAISPLLEETAGFLARAHTERCGRVNLADQEGESD